MWKRMFRYAEKPMILTVDQQRHGIYYRARKQPKICLCYEYPALIRS
jgi:hypothetical protein